MAGDASTLNMQIQRVKNPNAGRLDAYRRNVSGKLLMDVLQTPYNAEWAWMATWKKNYLFGIRNNASLNRPKRKSCSFLNIENIRRELDLFLLAINSRLDL